MSISPLLLQTIAEKPIPKSLAGLDSIANFILLLNIARKRYLVDRADPDLW